MMRISLSTQSLFDGLLPRLFAKALPLHCSGDHQDWDQQAATISKGEATSFEGLVTTDPSECPSRFGRADQY